MDSDLIRREIDRTSDRIDRTLHELERRAGEVARRAVRWGTVALASAAIVAGVIVVYAWRRRSPRSADRPRAPRTTAAGTTAPRQVKPLRSDGYRTPVARI